MKEEIGRYIGTALVVSMILGIMWVGYILLNVAFSDIVMVREAHAAKLAVTGGM